LHTFAAKLTIKTNNKMKKLFLFLAVAGLISFAACKSSETKTEATADSTAAQVETVVDSAAAVVDTTVAQ